MAPDHDAILGLRLRLAAHAVRRRASGRPVVQNLRTGTYHALNPTALRMLAAITERPTVRDAAAEVATEYARDIRAVEADMVRLCRDLLQRKLVEPAHPPADPSPPKA